MPIARFQMPDGRVARFEVPEGTTPEQAQSMMEAHFSGAPNQAPTPAPGKRALTAEEAPGVGQTLLIGAGRTFDKVLDGMTQMYLGVKGENSALAGLKKNYDDKTELYKPLQEARPYATGIGEALPAMAIPVGGGAGALSTAGRLAVAGAAPAALEYGTADERLKRAAVGGAAAVVGGTVVPRVLSGAGNLLSRGARSATGGISPEVQALYARAQQLGIPVNAAQLGDSKFLKTLQSTIEQIPLTGGVQARNAQQRAFNRAVSNTFGEDATAITRDVYDAARTRIGGQFNALTARNNLNGNMNMLGRLGSISDEATRFATDDTGRAVTNAIDELLSKADANGVIPGRAYQALDSQLGRLMKGGGEKARYLGEIQATIRGVMDQSISGADREAWGTARAQYRNLKTIRDLVAKEGADGNISPSLLMGRVNANNAGKEAMARGSRGDLGELAVIGKQFVRDPVPNSGTAQRTFANALLGGLGGGGAILNLPATAAVVASTIGTGRAVNAALNSPTVTNALIQGAPSFLDAISANPPLLARLLGGAGGIAAGNELARR